MESRNIAALAVGSAALLAVVGATVAAAAQRTDARPQVKPALPTPGALRLHRPLPRAVAIRSPYGMRQHPTLNEYKMHEGIDLPAPVGTEVYAPADGVVARIDQDGTGRGVWNGNAVHVAVGSHRFAFLHLSQIDVVSGQRVVRGQRIGLSGATGRVSGPHLHVQIYDGDGNTVDPVKVYPPETFQPDAQVSGVGEDLRATLDPNLAEKWDRIAARLRAAGWRPFIIVGWRSPAQQRWLYRAGRSKVEWSYHCMITPDGEPAALAIDIGDSRYEGKTDAASVARAAAFYKALGVEAAREGLTWGGSWSKSSPTWAAHGLGWDPMHVQLYPNSSLADVRAVYDEIVSDAAEQALEVPPEVDTI